MLIKINRQDCIKEYTNLPLRKYNFKKQDYDFSYPKVFANYVLTLNSKSYKGHIQLLGRELTNLIRNLNCDKLIFLGDEDISWLYRSQVYNDFKPAKAGMQFLANNKIGKKFNGALQVGLVELPTFIKHLAWLVRTNALIPYVHFINIEQNIIGNVCQYGNLHISAINKKADNFLKEKIVESKFEYLREKTCYNKFSKSGKIKGRQIIV